MWGIESSQIHRSRKQNGDCQELGRKGNEELLIDGCKVTVMHNEKVLEIYCATLGFIGSCTLKSLLGGQI